MPLRFWPFELNLCDSCWDPAGVFPPRMRQACQVQKVVMGLAGAGEPWAQRSQVSTLPQDLPVCCFHDNTGHWGVGVSVLPRGLDEQAWQKFQLEAEAKDLG